MQDSGSKATHLWLVTAWGLYFKGSNQQGPTGIENISFASAASNEALLLQSTLNTNSTNSNGSEKNSRIEAEFMGARLWFCMHGVEAMRGVRLV